MSHTTHLRGCCACVWRQGFGIFLVLAAVFLAWNGYVYAKSA